MAAGGNHRDVMLSYCWKNQTRVFKLRDRLVAKGVSVWIDENDMIGDIFHAMTAAIKNSNLFVPCVSAKYATSQNAMREFTYAYNLQRSNIVPVKLENEPLGDKLDFLMGPLLYQTCFEDADCDRVAEYILKLIRDQNIQPTNDKDTDQPLPEFYSRVIIYPQWDDFNIRRVDDIGYGDDQRITAFRRGLYSGIYWRRVGNGFGFFSGGVPGNPYKFKTENLDQGYTPWQFMMKINDEEPMFCRAVGNDVHNPHLACVKFDADGNVIDQYYGMGKIGRRNDYGF